MRLLPNCRPAPWLRLARRGPIVCVPCQLLLVEREPDAHLRAEGLPASRGGTLLVYLGLVFVQRIDAVAGRNLADVESGFPQPVLRFAGRETDQLGNLRHGRVGGPADDQRDARSDFGLHPARRTDHLAAAALLEHVVRGDVVAVDQLLVPSPAMSRLFFA